MHPDAIDQELLDIMGKMYDSYSLGGGTDYNKFISSLTKEEMIIFEKHGVFESMRENVVNYMLTNDVLCKKQ